MGQFDSGFFVCNLAEFQLNQTAVFHHFIGARYVKIHTQIVVGIKSSDGAPQVFSVIKADLNDLSTDSCVGVNIGANKDTQDRIADFVKGIETFSEVASYFAVNISSPNTPGLRDLQAPEALNELLERVMNARAAIVAAGKPKRPIVVKLSPDIAEEDLGAIVACLMSHNVDGIAVSNTTLTRKGLRDPAARETGGLSGRPLFHRSTVMLARVYEATGGKIPLIGIGGIDSGETALAKIEAGATLVQLYTGLIYEGPGLIQRIKDHLTQAVRREGVFAISDLIGKQAQAWATKPLDA